LRALHAQGASSAQVFLYGVLPSTLPRCLAYVLYRWEVCIRATVMVGFVGAGGIGRLLADQLGSFDYRGVTASLLAMLVLYWIFGSSPGNKMRRFGMVTGLRPDRIAYYERLHAAVWPGVLKKIKECNIQNYSIYLQAIDDKYYLFSYFEYTGADFDGDMKKMAADSTTRRWWKETAPTQIPLPEAASNGQTWVNMKEVFHTQ